MDYTFRQTTVFQGKEWSSLLKAFHKSPLFKSFKVIKFKKNMNFHIIRSSALAEAFDNALM